MTKRFCDICSNPVKDNLSREGVVHIAYFLEERYKYDDICENCFDNIRKMIREYAKSQEIPQ